MTNTDIKPALTHDEWARLRKNQAAFEPIPEDPPDDPDKDHEDMALANDRLPDDDPRKITRADVWVLRDAVYHIREGGTPDDECLITLAAKIAALLPPE